MSINMRCQGFVSWRVEKRSTGEVVRESGGFYPNLVTDEGLDNLHDISAAALTTYCRVGTDSTPPAVTNTGLGAQVGNPASGGNDVNSNSGSSPYWHGYTRDYTFEDDGIEGVALAELGFFVGTAPSAVMFSRVLFKDGGGTPVTITLLVGEILIITYELRSYVPDETPVSGTFDVDHGAGPVTYNYSMRPINVSSSRRGPGYPIVPAGVTAAYENDVLADPDSSSPPTGGLASGSLSTPAPGAYVPGTFSKSLSISGTINDANFPSGIGGIVFVGPNNTHLYHAVFTPKIPKDNTEVLDFQNFFTITWDRGALP